MKISGRNVVYEALKNNIFIDSLFLHDNDNLKKIAEQKKIKYKECDKNFLDKTFGQYHQGAGAFVEDFKYETIDNILLKNNKNILILDNIVDPHNLGAIIRTAEATSVSAIIIPKDRSANINSTVCKVSTGAVFNVDIVLVNNISRCIEKLKDNNVFVYGTDLSASNSHYDANFKGDIAIVIGNEGKGIRKMVKKSCDDLIKIPMTGQINSLNASVSTAIIVYEVLRQRNI